MFLLLTCCAHAVPRDTIISVSVTLKQFLEPGAPPQVQIHTYMQRLDERPSKGLGSPRVPPDAIYRFMDTLISVFRYGKTFVVKAILPPKSALNGIASYSGQNEGKSFFTIVYPLALVAGAGAPYNTVKLTINFDCKATFEKGVPVSPAPEPEKKLSPASAPGTSSQTAAPPENSSEEPDNRKRSRRKVRRKI